MSDGVVERLFIDGSWTAPVDGEMIEVLNPATEESIGRAALAGERDLDRAVRAARAALDTGQWSRNTPDDRAAILRRASQLLGERADEFTELLVAEVGSPQRVAGFQPVTGQKFLDWHADQAGTYPWEQERDGLSGPLMVRRTPVGVVGAIVPWNAPLVLAMAKIAPALLCGNSLVLKTPDETPLFGYMLAEVFEAAGTPPGVFNVIAADRAVSEELVVHPLVDKISFTGSTRAGAHIAALCGDRLKRCSLELGGKSAAIVLEGADVGDVIEKLAPSTMANNGQVCVNQTRVLAHRDQYDDVVAALREAVAAFNIGDPADPSVDVGPLISAVQRERVESLIETGRGEGARVVLGGGRPPFERGYFVEPTIFADVDNAMTIAQEEIFGPVVCVIRYENVDDAIRIANDSRYGLSGSVWGPDLEHAKDVARRIRSGNVAINQHTLDIAGPFGGFKQSGIGREYGPEGIEQYLELQSIPYVRA